MIYLIKKRNWAFIIYPESLPIDYLDLFKTSGLEIAISPLHDKDINPTGEFKKPHYHVICCFGNPTTYNNVLEFTKQFNGTIPKPLESVKGMYRYLTHKDNPEKAQYSESDITLINGFDVSSLLNSTEVFSLMKQIHKLIIFENITEYSDLMNYLLSEEQTDMYNVAMNHTLYFNTLITSIRHKQEKKTP